MVNRKVNAAPSQSLEHAMRVIEILAEADELLSTADLSKHLKLPKSTIHRLLKTLLHQGYVEQEAETRRYRLSLRIFELASKVLTKLDVYYHATPFFKELMEQTNETVNLAVVPQQGIVIAARLGSSFMWQHLFATVEVK